MSSGGRESPLRVLECPEESPFSLQSITRRDVNSFVVSRHWYSTDLASPKRLSTTSDPGLVRSSIVGDIIFLLAEGIRRPQSSGPVLTYGSWVEGRPGTLSTNGNRPEAVSERRTGANVRDRKHRKGPWLKYNTSISSRPRHRVSDCNGLLTVRRSVHLP